MRARVISAPPHIVGVFPHPDDEAYSAAGSLALAADRGARVTIVCATRGEAAKAAAAFPGADERERRDALARMRTAELEASCRVIGAGPPCWLDVADGAIAASATLAAKLEATLDELRADCLVTLSADGVYGHRDHVALTDAVRGYVRAMPVTERPRLLFTEFPSEHFRPFWQRLGARRTRRLIVERTPWPLGIERAEADLIVDISAAAERKRRALACHRTQLGDAVAEDFLMPGLLAPLLVEEWFTLDRDSGAEGKPPGPADELRWVLA